MRFSLTRRLELWPSAALVLATLAVTSSSTSLVSATPKEEGEHIVSGTYDSEAEASSLLRLPLLSRDFVQRRKLQTTPQEEEGHPQVVDALYQGYGEHVSGRYLLLLLEPKGCSRRMRCI